MKLTVKNIGPVKESTIDLDKNLLVLCGGNNTGKTYVAYTVYGINKTAKNSGLYENLVFDEKFYEDLKENKIVKLNLSEVTDKIHNSITGKTILLDNSVPYFFGLDINNANNKYFPDSHIQLSFSKEELFNEILAEKIHANITMFGDDQPSFFIKKLANEESIEFISVIPKEFISESGTYLFEDIVPYYFLGPILRKLFPRIYIAPAERTAINLFSHEILSQKRFVLQELQANPKAVREIRRYPLPIEESLENSNSLGFRSERISEFYYLADLLEQYLLDGGKMGLSEYGEVMYQTEGENKANLPIHMTASVVKSLSSIIFYFRHMAQQGDFIIIDEPELNLHPDNQRKIARWLVRVVNAGFKVMITTHSDYIIREFNNLIMLQTAKNVDLKKKMMEEFGYNEEELLNPEEVGAYLFRKDGTCEDLEVNDTGFSVDSIDEEISKLNNITDALYYELHND